MEKLNINLSNDEIRNMTKYKFNNLIRNKCKERAYEYLMNKRGKKGQQISYTCLRMSEYLLPNEKLSIENQRKIFEIRNDMLNIPANFTSEKNNTTTCICGKKEDTLHLYNCENLNNDKPKEEFNQIFGNNLNKMKNIENRFKEIMKKREKFQEILICDPLQYCSNGYK